MPKSDDIDVGNVQVKREKGYNADDYGQHRNKETNNRERFDDREVQVKKERKYDTYERDRSPLRRNRNESQGRSPPRRDRERRERNRSNERSADERRRHDADDTKNDRRPYRDGNQFRRREESNNDQMGRPRRDGPQTWGQQDEKPMKRFVDKDGNSIDKDGNSIDKDGNLIEKQKPNFDKSGKLTEHSNTFNGVVIKYNEPKNAKKPNKRKWRLYPYKGEEALPLMHIHRQSAFLFGRDRRVADIPLDHPSISQQHAVLQFKTRPYTKADGKITRAIYPYIIDLDSSNGTLLNSNKIDPQRFVELREGDVLKFGFSTREYVVMSDTTTELNLSENEDLS